MPRDCSPDLPPPEDYTGTSVIWNLWVDIVQETFPMREGYHVRLESEPISGRADCKVYHFEQTRNPKKVEFLGIECKQGHHETQDDSWDLAREQLITYLTGFQGSAKVFGAICMGKNVRFYRFFPAQDDEPATIEEMDENVIRIDRQPQTVVRRLEYIKSSVS
ncbi:unnamed protein product [Clonostachys rhizophaga]|uniref:Uncharacterized protein n=1 Tax=Clonostachys rhizophaga TaxID=160324 RepID=A0A9N9W423_9HYPO|nr:unnamed protein product [Clonostachys rhizophaga]